MERLFCRIKSMRSIATFSRRSPRLAFTLVELMVSIALALILMLGINYIFKATSQTVSTGFALSAVTRQQRSVNRAFDDDFDFEGKGYITTKDMPCIVIFNEQVPAFRDRNDMNTDSDTDPMTIDVNGVSQAVAPFD